MALLKIREVADKLRVSTHTVRRLARERKLRTVKLGATIVRYESESVDVLLKQHTAK